MTVTPRIQGCTMTLPGRHIPAMLILLVSLAGCGQSDGGADSTEGAASHADANSDTARPQVVPGDGVVDFKQKGVLTSAAALFGLDGDRESLDMVRTVTSDRAFVTADGVYAFLETPGNFAHLAQVKGEQSLLIKGKLLARGRLVHIESTQPVEGKVPFDMTKYYAYDGQVTTMTGVNKCMCGIKIARMHPSCELGHLHHLVASDGKIYHYVQLADGADAAATMKYHSMPVSVTGRILPGQFISVETIETR